MTRKTMLTVLPGAAGACLLAAVIAGGVYALRTPDSIPSAGPGADVDTNLQRQIQESLPRRLVLLRKVDELETGLSGLQAQIGAATTEISSSTWQQSVKEKWEHVRSLLTELQVEIELEIDTANPPAQDPAAMEISTHLQGFDPSSIEAAEQALSLLTELENRGLEARNATGLKDRHDTFARKLDEIQAAANGLSAHLSSLFRLKPGESGKGPYGIEFVWVSTGTDDGFHVSKNELSISQYAKSSAQATPDAKALDDPKEFLAYTKHLNESWKEYLPEDATYGLPNAAQWKAIDAASTQQGTRLQKVQSGHGEWVIEAGKSLVAGPSDWAIANNTEKRKFVTSSKQPMSRSERLRELKYQTKPEREVNDGRPKTRRTKTGFEQYQLTKTLPAEYAYESPRKYAARIVISD